MQVNEILESPDKIQIQNIGATLLTDEDGFIISQSSPEKIKPPWDEAVEDVKEAYIENLGEKNIHSIYIKGSVSRGTPLEGISDIDALVVVNKLSSELNLDWTKTVSKKLKEKYPFCTDFDFGVVSYEEVMEGKRPIAKCLIKVSSACIHGEDLAKELPKVKPGPECFICARNIGNYVERKIDLLQDKTKEIDETNQSKWVMKYLLRASFELVMEREGVFTRDLYPSYEYFSKHYPEKEAIAKRVLEAAIRQNASREELLDILEDFGRWIALEKEKLYPQ